MLEEAIKENTAVLRELLARLSSGAALATAAPAPAAKAAEKPAADPKPAVQPQPAPATATKLNYETDIKPVALALAKSNRPALTAIWVEFGVKVGSELKPEQFEAALAKIQAASK